MMVWRRLINGCIWYLLLVGGMTFLVWFIQFAPNDFGLWQELGGFWNFFVFMLKISLLAFVGGIFVGFPLEQNQAKEEGEHN